MSEAQTRPLAPLNEEQRVAAWQAAVADAPDGRPTARQVEENDHDPVEAGHLVKLSSAAFRARVYWQTLSPAQRAAVAGRTRFYTMPHLRRADNAPDHDNELPF